MFLNKDKKSNYIFVFFLYILFFCVFDIFLFLQAIVSWLAACQLPILCCLLEQRLLLLWGKYPLIGRRTRTGTRLVARIHTLLRRRLCLLIILRKHARSISAPDILRGHSVLIKRVATQ